MIMIEKTCEKIESIDLSEIESSKECLMYNEKFRITVLVEDTRERKYLLSEHGLSFFVESDGIFGLFDTGQTDVITKNARILNIPLEKISWIFLSHGHRDHTGGLENLPGISNRVKIYGHPDILKQKYIKESDGSWREYGVTKDIIKRFEVMDYNLNLSEESIRIKENIITSGQISRKTDYETIGKRFYIEDNSGKKPDIFLDDMSIILETSKGMVVLLGCAHAGVVNILNHVKDITGKDKIYSVIGGMHLINASRERIDKTIDEFGKLDIKKIGLAHCTGKNAVNRFFDEFGDRCFLCPVGTVIEF